jgi:hypothetical protein
MNVKDSNRDPATPPQVVIEMEPRQPVTDPTLGISLPQGIPPSPSNRRLVILGDSISHGFQSGAIFNTDLSYAAIIAWEMGWLDSFRFPTYQGFGGLPLNLEFLARDLETKFDSDARGEQFLGPQKAPHVVGSKQYGHVVVSPGCLDFVSGNHEHERKARSLK